MPLITFDDLTDMVKRKILFICGSLNQTLQMYLISKALPEYDSWFSPYYSDGLEKSLYHAGLAEMTVMGNKLMQRCLAYLKQHHLQIDNGGSKHDYGLVVTCSDLIVQKNIRHKKIVLVQEGMTDPESLAYHLVKKIPILPRWIAGTATNGLSHAYQKFCVASEGYRDLFISKGVDPNKIRVTGIPNFDHCELYYDNDFPYKGFVLVCTSDTRETFRYENRKKFIHNALTISDGRQLIFKLHPNENHAKATYEINRWAPQALVFHNGSAEHMIANCDILITRFSSTVYVGMALGKKVYSDFPLEQLRRLVPIQNNGMSALNIAEIVRDEMDNTVVPFVKDKPKMLYHDSLKPVLQRYSKRIQRKFRAN
jgi:hypothetical protein